ncbi:MAG: ACT domain-containing protein [Micropruina sp.]|nr:MAG: ACT domain-containing protein [Micropruina sp.]
MTNVPALTNLSELIASLSVRRRGGRFAVTTHRADPGGPADARIAEDEGVTLIVPVAQAAAHGWAYDGEFAWLTLGVPSALDAVGLTAAVADVLARRGIPCNVLAGFHHDHLLVPQDRADEALAALAELSARGLG